MGNVDRSTNVESIMRAQHGRLRAWHIISSILVAAFLVVAGLLAYYGITESSRLADDALSSRNASWTYEHVSKSISPSVADKLSQASCDEPIVENEDQLLYDEVKEQWEQREVTYPVSGELSPEQGSVEFLDIDTGSTPPISSPALPPLALRTPL